MKVLWTLALAAIMSGAMLLYSGWDEQPPSESELVAVSGQITKVQHVTRTRWGGRRHLFPKTIYVGHDLYIRSQDGNTITLRLPEWEGIPESRIEGLVEANIRGRYDARRNTLYELVAGNTALSTYFSSARVQSEDRSWNLTVGGIAALVGVLLAALAFRQRTRPEPAHLP